MKVINKTFAACILCAVSCVFLTGAQQADGVNRELTESQQSENEQFQSFLSDSPDSPEQSDQTSDAASSLESGEESTVALGIWAFIRMLLVLALIVVAIYFVFRFIKKSSASGGEQTPDDDVFLRKVSRVGLGAGQSVQIVSLWDRAFVLGVSDGSVSLIKEIDDKEMVDAMNRFADMNNTVKKPRTFEEILNIFSSVKSSVKRSSSPSASTPVKKPAPSAYDEKTMSLIASLKAKRLSLEDETTGGEE